MTKQEALARINAAKTGNSNYTGMEFEYYTGLGDPSLDFNGNDAASLVSAGDAAEPFIVNVVNASASARSFYLSVGLLYTRGSESIGQLKTGAFQAVEDTGTATSLTASTTNAVTIEQFIAYYRAFPVFNPLIQLTSTSPTGQLSQSISYFKQGMIKNTSPNVIPLRKYAKGDQYNLEFQDIIEPLYLSSQDIVQIFVAGSSTLTLNLYPLAAKNNRKELQNDVSTAKRVIASNPAGVMAADQAVKISRG
jgi:hypothetical protein